MYTKLISVETLERFLTIQSSLNPFPDKSIVIIENTNQIWTHGIFINGISLSTSTENDVTLAFGGYSYKLALADYYHKKNSDIELGTYTDALNKEISYALKASNHNLIYRTLLLSIEGIHIGNSSDSMYFCSSNTIKRYYISGNTTTYYNILDSYNTSMSLTDNALSYKFGTDNPNEIYLARHDSSNTLPENSNNKFSRLGGSSTAGWIVMNTALKGDGSYYVIKVTNDLTKPILYIKPPSGNDYTKIISENDVFIGAGGSTAATTGLVPAPTLPNTYLKGDGTWSTILPTPYSAGCYLHVSNNNELEWVSDNSSSYSEANFSNINLYTNWSNIDNLSSRLGNADGSYILLIVYYGRIYTGLFSYASMGYYIDDEIVLHCSGTEDLVGGVLRGRLYAKIKATNSTIYLLLAVTRLEDNSVLKIKYKKVI